jgi:integrase
MSLTEKKIAKLPVGRYFDKDQLYLQVQGPTNRSWLLRYVMNGRERWLGLGAYRTFNLREARLRARKARQAIADGVDPIDAKRAERTAQALEAARLITFETATRQYFDMHERKWRNARHRAQFLSSLRQYAFPVIGRLPVAAIDTGLVLKCVEPIWADRVATAARVRGRIESVLDWATVRGYRTGDNPARWRGHLAEVLPAPGAQKAKHHAALPYGEVPGFMATLRAHTGIAARALEFAILTAARSGSVLGATWDEIDFEANTWTVPSGRMKMQKEHRTPLCTRALEILESLPRETGNPHVFIGARRANLGEMELRRALRRVRAGGSVHGFRSSFRDWAAERTNFPSHIIEMALAHTVGNAVERAYLRSDLYDKRRKLMESWSRFCMTAPPVSGKPPVESNVLALRSA